MTRFEVVIAGGGVAAARAIGAYREAGGERRVALVSREPELPYHRPPLSKRFLRGETTETPRVEEESFYRDHDVDVLLGTSATSVDLQARSVALDDGGRLAYRKLLVATGATPRTLRVPGADLDGVFTFRTVADSSAVRAAAAAGRRAVIVGGGFIGMEVAASLRQLGLDVTLVHMGDGLFDQLHAAALSEQLLALYREQDVDVRLEEEVIRFGGDGRLEWVETKSGACVEAEIAVVGIGVVPNIGVVRDSGLPLENGIVVDERFEAAAGVYAVGDVANFFDPLYGRRRRIEHWSNGSYQGAEVGKILAGRRGGYDTVSSFFSEVFGRTIRVFGDTSRFDELHEDGSLQDGFLAVYGYGGRLVGVISVGQSDELEAAAKRLIAERAPSDALQRELAGSVR